jgi:hypothetical protein
VGACQDLKTAIKKLDKLLRRVKVRQKCMQQTLISSI